MRYTQARISIIFKILFCRRKLLNVNSFLRFPLGKALSRVFCFFCIKAAQTIPSHGHRILERRPVSH